MMRISLLNIGAKIIFEDVQRNYKKNSLQNTMEYDAQNDGTALTRNDPQVEENQAHLHGDHQEFDIALIPLHICQPDAWRCGEHWLLDIYDSRDTHQHLQLYDPKIKMEKLNLNTGK
jgi:hypothetical protein